MAGLGHVAISLGLNSGEFNKGIKEVNSQLGNLNKMVRSTSGVLKEVPDDLEAMVKQTKNLDLQAKLLTEKLKEQEKQLNTYQDVVNEVTDGGKDMSKMTEAMRKELTRLGSEVSKTEDDIKKNSIQQGKLKDNIDKTTKALKDESGALSDKNGKLSDSNNDMQKAVNKQDDLTDAVKRSEKALKDEADAYKLRKERAEAKLDLADNVSSGLNTVGNGALAVSGAGIAAGAYTIKKAMEVEDANTNIYRVADIAVEDRVAFADDLLEKFANSTFESYSEMASIFEGLGAAGLTSADEMSEGYEAIKDLAIASGQGAESVTQLLTSASGLLQFQKGEMTKYASALAAGGNAGSSTDAEVQTMASQLSGLTVQGVSNPNIVSLASFWSSAGINPEAARSGSTSIFNQLKNANNSDEDGDGKTIATVTGLSNEQYDEMRKNDPTELFERFVVGLKSINDAGGDVSNTLASLGFDSSIENDILMKSAAQASMFEEVQVAVTDAYNSGTVAQTEAAIAAETSSKKMQQALNELNVQFIKIGGELLPLFVDFLEAAQPALDMMSDFADWFSELDDSQKEFYVNLVLGIGAFGLLSKGMSGVISFGTGITRFFGGTATLLGKIFKSSKDVSGALKILGSTTDDLGGSLVNGIGATTTFNSTVGTTTTNAGLLTGAFTGLSGALLTLGGLGALSIGLSLIIGELEDNYNAARSDLNGYLDGLDPILRAEVEKHRGVSLETKVNVKTTYSGSIDEDSITSIKETLEKDKEESEELFKSARGRNTYEETGNATIDDALKSTAEERGLLIDAAEADYAALSSEINSTLEDAYNNNRDLTLKEMNLIDEKMAKMDELEAKVSTSNLTDYQKTLKALNSEYGVDTDPKVIKASIDSVPTRYDEIQSKRDSALSLVDETFKGVNPSNEDYKAAIQAINDEFNKQEKELALEYYEALRADNNKLNPFDDDKKLEKRMVTDKFNMSNEEFNLLKGRKDFEDKNLLNTASGTSEQIASSELWNSFFVNLTDSEFENNPLTKLKEYMSGENGVAGIESMLNNVDLTDDMKVILSEAAIDAGTWNQLSFEKKSLIIEDDDLAKVNQSIVDSGLWETLNKEQQLGMVNSDAETAKKIALISDGWEGLDVASKSEILGRPITEAENEFMNLKDLWQNEHFMKKYLEIDTSDADKAKSEFDKLAEKSDNMPKTKIDVDIDGFRYGTQIVLDSWNNLNAIDKTASFFFTVSDGVTKVFNDLRSNIPIWLEELKTKFGSFYTEVGELRDKILNFGGKVKDGVVSLFTDNRNSYSNSQYGIPNTYAKGTSYHPGGLAVLGDGGKNEPFMTPSGAFGISPSTDTLFNLPQGSKVWSSMEKFIADLPHFANGTDQSFLNSTSLAGLSGNSNQNQNTVNLTVNMNAPNTTFSANDRKLLVNEVVKATNRTNKQHSQARGGK